MIETTFSLVGFENFLLIFVRIASFVFIAPILGQKGIPNRVKAGTALFVAILLYNVVEHPDLEYVSVVGYAVYVVREGITGLLIGYAANICSSIVLFAGHMVDVDIGLSMATQFNPDMNTELTISGNIYYYFVMMLLLISDMHLWVLRAACDSYYFIPIGGADFQMDKLLSSMVRFVGDSFIIGFRIFLPVFACIMVLNCILGIMAKVAPQMNMFAVGIQLKVLTGMGILFLTIFMLPGVADFVYVEIKNMVGLFIDGMYQG